MHAYVCLYLYASIGTFSSCSTVVEDCAVTKGNPKKRGIPVSIFCYSGIVHTDGKYIYLVT